MDAIRGRMDAGGKRFVIVVSRWNELVTKQLVEGALDELKAHGDPKVEIVSVPGTWELPVAVRKIVTRKQNKPNGVIALGCILQGQTTHAKLLGSDVSSGLMSLQAEHGIPIAWGVLTPDTMEQALERAGMKHGNKGREAALAAIEMASLLDNL